MPIPAKVHRPVAAVLLAAMLLAAGCAPGRARVPVAAPVPELVVTPVPLPPTPEPEALAPPVVEALVAAVRARLAMPVSACGATVLDSRELAPFYPADEPALLWLSANGTTARASALRAALQAAGDEGLDAARYPLADIDWYGSAASVGEQACLELLLTDAFRRYSRDLHSGRLDPRVADPDWYLEPAPFDPAAALAAVRDEDGWRALLAGLPPPAGGYQRLRAARARYQTLARRGGWAPLPDGPTLEPGMAHPQVALLRARLRIEGDLGANGRGDNGYDAALAATVQRFQRRHGLDPDGVVGTRTRAALNVPVAERVAQLERTMERWRWLPRPLGEHYIWVNTAAFELAVVERGRTVLAMRAIVGTPDQATPSFMATPQSLVINPYWNVPARIARDRLLPRQQANRHFFASRAIRVFADRDGALTELDPARIDWARVTPETFSYLLRQEPGPKNSMGRLAFSMPNPFDVFLHDTPERHLFARDSRAFSEGCVRIENAMALALHALRSVPEWTEARLREAIDALANRRVALPEPIPVYVLYLPAWVDDAGAAHFADDIYQREGVLARHYPAAAADR